MCGSACSLVTAFILKYTPSLLLGKQENEMGSGGEGERDENRAKNSTKGHVKCGNVGLAALLLAPILLDTQCFDSTRAGNILPVDRETADSLEVRALHSKCYTFFFATFRSSLYF